MSADHWMPGASLRLLELRATLLTKVRAFFAERAVMEVETPLLCSAGATDLHLDSFRVEIAPGEYHFLQTSPEFAMKRLLAAGSGPVFQLCKAFRRDEAGSRHNPEFSMLEWYRLGFDTRQLMAEVEALLRATVPDSLPAKASIPQITYRELFQQQLEIDPFEASDAEMQALAEKRLDIGQMRPDRNAMLDLLMSHLIEPELQSPVFVVDFPASQAALAQICNDAGGARVARRFELFVRGMELANGYLELGDAAEQAQRFAQDNRARRSAGLAVIPVDQYLLAALAHGLPECAGVALGFDRLLMLASDVKSIGQVLAFDAKRV
jgi:elongation factor P--(R)-beta-lysine ligase